jgi:hypothetical protein
MRLFIVVTIRVVDDWCFFCSGASFVDTLEYGYISTSHPQLRALLPEQFALASLASEKPRYDFAATFSSLEHSGLGRYGDALNPFGDLEVIALDLQSFSSVDCLLACLIDCDCCAA